MKTLPTLGLAVVLGTVACSNYKPQAQLQYADFVPKGISDPETRRARVEEATCRVRALMDFTAYEKCSR